MPRKRGKSFWRLLRVWPADGEWFVVVTVYRPERVRRCTMMERVVGFADVKSAQHARHVRPLLAKGGMLVEDSLDPLADWTVVKGDDACPIGITWSALYRAANPRPALLRDVTRLLHAPRERQGDEVTVTVAMSRQEAEAIGAFLHFSTIEEYRVRCVTRDGVDEARALLGCHAGMKLGEALMEACSPLAAQDG